MKNEIYNDNEVYVGGGKTITVTTGAQTKVFDIPKALAIFEKNKNAEVCMGMAEDWVFTGQQVESVEEIEKFPLMSSRWATPVIKIDGEREDCYIAIDKEHYSTIHAYGFRGGINKADFWLTDFYKRWRKLEYEPLKKFWAEVDTLLARYEPFEPEDKENENESD